MAFNMQSTLWRRGLMLAWAGILSVAGITLASAAIAAADAPLPQPAVLPDPVRIVLRPPVGLRPAIIPGRIAADASVEEALKKLADEHRCLSEVMYFEARGEGEEGQKAVAQVIFNRLESGLHGKTLCAVVYEGQNQTFCQFTFACDGSVRKPRSADAWRAAQVLAARILAGQLPGDAIGGATAYHAAWVHPNWGPNMQEVARIGSHIFYRAADNKLLGASFRGSVE